MTIMYPNDALCTAKGVYFVIPQTLDLRSVYSPNSNTHPLSGPYIMQDTIVSLVALSSKKLLPLFSMGRGPHSTDLEARGQLGGFGSVISPCGSEKQTGC